MNAWAIVLAAGGGSRFGARKQFERLGELRLVDHAVATAAAVCEGVVVVLPHGVVWSGAPVAAEVEGGASRAASVRAGLAVIPASVEIIVIHDAAHPLASRDVFVAVIEAVRGGSAGAVPCLPLTEALKVVVDGRLHTMTTGKNLVFAQMPHAFRADALRTAHADAENGVEDSAMVEAAGWRVVPVPGDPINVHVTVPEELRLARRLASAI